MSRICCQSASGKFRSVLPLTMPALLTSTSRLPNWSTAVSTAACQSPGTVTSRCTNRAAGPNWRARAWPSASRMSPAITRAPCATSARACAAPIPRAPPLISATLPATRPMAAQGTDLAVEWPVVARLWLGCVPSPAAGWDCQTVLPRCPHGGTCRGRSSAPRNDSWAGQQTGMRPRYRRVTAAGLSAAALGGWQWMRVLLVRAPARTAFDLGRRKGLPRRLFGVMHWPTPPTRRP